MSTHDDGRTKRDIDNHHLQHLTETRASAVAAREQADTVVRANAGQIMEILQAAGVSRHQLPNGTIVQVVQGKDRASIVAERLLGHGVSPQIIEDSTKYSPVAPFIRVDAPGAGNKDMAQTPTMAANVDQAGTITDTPPN
jgi:hypothetical protein